MVEIWGVIEIVDEENVEIWGIGRVIDEEEN
jgi:hypothetical protein